MVFGGVGGKERKGGEEPDVGVVFGGMASAVQFCASLKGGVKTRCDLTRLLPHRAGRGGQRTNHRGAGHSVVLERGGWRRGGEGEGGGGGGGGSCGLGFHLTHLLSVENVHADIHEFQLLNTYAITRNDQQRLGQSV